MSSDSAKHLKTAACGDTVSGQMPQCGAGSGKDRLYQAACLYISLPLFVFFAGFLRWYYALAGCAALLAVLLLVLRGNTQRRTPSVSWKTVGAVFLFCLLWSYLGGMNGFYYQSFDWDCRNAVYFDLIRFDWPVIYSNGGALVYYIGHWLPPAAAAKLFTAVTGSPEAGLLAGRMLLWLWSSAGLTIVILLLFRLLQVRNRRQQIAAVFLFVFFSGMDLVGAVLFNTLDTAMRIDTLHALTPHLEHWSGGMQFSSMMTLLFWVFNQTIVPWVITLCFLLDDSPRSYVFYCVCCLLSGPFSCVGLVVLMVVRAGAFCVERIRQGLFRDIFRRILSLQNLLSFCLPFPLVAGYILSSNAAGGAAAAAGVGGAAVQSQGTSLFSAGYLNSQLYIFVIMEVGVYLFLVAVDHFRDPLYYTCWATFILFPCVHVGASIDFCMRATIPALFVLMVYVSRFLLEHLSFVREEAPASQLQTIRSRCAKVLLVCYILGMGTPLVELYRGAYHVIHEKTIFLEDQRLMTFEGREGNYNFVTAHPEYTFFFRHMAKTNATEDGEGQ